MLHNWTDEDTFATLQRYWTEGKTAGEIGAIMGTTRNAILGAVHRHGLASRPPGGPRKSEDGNPRVLASPSKPRPIKAPIAVLQRKPKKKKTDLLALEKEKLQRSAAPLIPGVSIPFFAEGYRGQKARVDIIGLQEHHCKYPIDGSDGVTRYCGLDRYEGKSYCLHHAARCGAAT